MEILLADGGSNDDSIFSNMSTAALVALIVNSVQPKKIDLLLLILLNYGSVTF